MSDCVYPCPEGFIADTLNISKKLRSLEIGNAVVLIIYDNQLAAILLTNTDRVPRLPRLSFLWNSKWHIIVMCLFKCWRVNFDLKFNGFLVPTWQLQAYPAPHSWEAVGEFKLLWRTQTCVVHVLIIVNLAPATVRKERSSYGLPLRMASSSPMIYPVTRL